MIGCSTGAKDKVILFKVEDTILLANVMLLNIASLYGGVTDKTISYNVANLFEGTFDNVILPKIATLIKPTYGNVTTNW